MYTHTHTSIINLQIGYDPHVCNHICVHNLESDGNYIQQAMWNKTRVLFPDSLHEISDDMKTLIFSKSIFSKLTEINIETYLAALFNY